jgi:hypothetical protein
MAPLLRLLVALAPAAWLALSASTAARPAVSAAAVRRQAPALWRQPFLQQVSSRTATVVWAAREPGAGELRYGLPDGPATSVPASTTLYSAAYTGMAFDYYQHETRLEGLAPGTTYVYEALVDGVVVTPSTDLLTTAPPNGTGAVRFIAFGDSGSGAAPQLQLADLMAADSAADRFDLALHTGDVVYPKGSYKLLHDRFFTVYEDWLRRRPIFMSFGNHEEYASKGRPYFDVFVLPENGYSSSFPDHRERYYSFDYGPVHFVALDTQLALASGPRQQEQLTWLVRDLESTAQPWKIVFFHRPAYGSSEFASSPDVRGPIRAILERYGVQLVLAGHEHSYARGVPWREGSPANSPVMHVVTGGGGAGLNTPVPGPWAAAWGGAYHYIRGTATDCTAAGSCELTLEAIGLAGTIIDSFTLPLREQRGDMEPPDVAWLEPLDGAVVSGPTTVSVEASDDTRIAKVDIRVDGELRLVDAVAPFEWTWDTTQELNGERELELRAIDIGGRVSSSKTRIVRVDNEAPTLRLLSPSGRDRAFSDLPFRIRWIATPGTSPMRAVSVEVSADGGKTFQPVPGCGSMPPDADECPWSAPAPLTRKGVIRVTVLDEAGRRAVAVSRPFEVRSGTTTLTVKNPNKAVTFGIGTVQALSWSSGLAQDATIEVGLSRDGGLTWTSLQRAFLNARQPYQWMVTDPATTRALIRLRSLGTVVEDVSDAPFSIATPTLTVAAPAPSTIWTAGSTAKVKWKGNLGQYDRLTVRLSTDGGATFPWVLAGAIPATQPAVAIVVPPVATSAARIMVQSLDRPEWLAVSPGGFVIR